MNVAIICIIVCVCSIEGTNAYKYENLDKMRAAVIRLCCGGGKRSLTGDVDGHWSLIAKPESDVALSVREDESGDDKTPNGIPSMSKIRAKSFILQKRVTVRGLHEECCSETCVNEEIREGSVSTPVEIGEECLNEGCDDHEIKEHC